MKPAVVITTINPPTEAITSWAQVLPLIVVADRKTPADPYRHLDLTYVPFTDSPELPSAPVNHYSRKNLGYLTAIRHGHDLIVDTDDDTWPALETMSLTPDELTRSTLTCATSEFVNVFRERLNGTSIWPRGFPLDEIHAEPTEVMDGGGSDPIGITQLLIDGDTDVDAVHRLVFGAQDVKFSHLGRLQVIPRNSFCPVNSQLTVFSQPAFPLLYLPTHVSFRFTDILRGVVAKRVLDAASMALAFGDPAGFQVRNPHSYFADFVDEVDVYLQVRRAWTCLESLPALPVPNLLRMSYERLNSEGIVPTIELTLVDEWLDALAALVS